MSNSELQRLLTRHGPDVDREIRRCIAIGQTSPKFGAMLAYQFGYVDERLQPTDESGGKRFRPLLCLLACEGVGGQVERALTVAAAIEILHNFSLVHDDIQDRDEMRRHRPTVWKLWGEAQGINVGDALFALASRAILEAPAEPQIVLALARRFGDTARALTEGQYIDMTFESRADVTADEYAFMIEHKTGALIEFSLWAGAVAGGGDDATLEAVSDFGHELGKAFQIHDDISGIWASRDRTGKEPGMDLQNGKKTLPVLLAAERAEEPYRAVLMSYISSEQVDIAHVMEALDSTGARAHAEARVRAHLLSARSALERARFTRGHINVLMRLAGELTAQLIPSM